MTSHVIYQGALRTSCTHVQSGTILETDAPVDNQGQGQRFSPTDLLATSLAACMLTVMGIKARDLQIDLSGLRFSVQKNMLTDPRRVGSIELHAQIPGLLWTLDEKTKKILKKTGETCPVIKSIHPDIKVNIDWAEWSGEERSEIL
jgi:putative redox protein